MEIENLPRLKNFKKVLRISWKRQLMERDTFNLQHVMQCYAIVLIKSCTILLV